MKVIITLKEGSAMVSPSVGGPFTQDHQMIGDGYSPSSTMTFEKNTTQVTLELTWFSTAGESNSTITFEWGNPPEVFSEPPGLVDLSSTYDDKTKTYSIQLTK